MVGGLSNIKGTPMEDIVRDVLARVASFSSMKLIKTKGLYVEILDMIIRTHLETKK